MNLKKDNHKLNKILENYASNYATKYFKILWIFPWFILLELGMLGLDCKKSDTDVSNNFWLSLSDELI